MSQSMEAWRRRCDHWMFDSHPIHVESLACFRVLYALFVLAFAMPTSGWIGDFPSSVFVPPPGPFALLGSFPPIAAIHALTLALSISLVALLFGYRTKLASIMAGVLLLTMTGFEFCFGMIDHTKHMMMLTPLALAWSGWGSRYSLDAVFGSVEARRQNTEEVGRGRWCVSLLAFVLGLFFFSSGLDKLLGGWLRLDGPTMRVYGLRAGWEPALWLDRTAGPWIWELADWGIVIYELGFLVAILSLGWTRILCAVSVLFHVTNIFLMQINFPEQMIVYGAFIEWKSVFARAPASCKNAASAIAKMRPSASSAGLVVLCFGGGYFAFHTLVGSPLVFDVHHSRDVQVRYWVPAVLIASVFLAGQLRRLVRFASKSRATS